MLSELRSNPLYIFALVAGFVWFVLALGRASRAEGPRTGGSLLIPLSLAAACVAPSAIAVAIDANARTATPAIEAKLSDVFLGLYICFACVGLMATTGSLAERLRGRGHLLGLMLAYWFVGFVSDTLNSDGTNRLSMWLVPLVLVSAAAMESEQVVRAGRDVTLFVCYASVGLAVVEPVNAYYLPTRVFHWERNRLAGITTHPNLLGLFAALALVLVLARPPRWRFVHIAIAVYVLIASESRGAWVAAIAAIALLLGRRLKRAPGGRRPRVIGALIAGAFMAMVATAALAKSSAVRATDLSSLNGRVPLWHIASGLWASSPVVGRGDGIWRSLLNSGTVPTYAGEAHNQLFETVASRGSLGLLVLVLLTATLIRHAVRLLAFDYWEPLLLLCVIAIYAAFSSPLTLDGVDAQLWITVVIAVGVTGVPAAAEQRRARNVALQPSSVQPAHS